MSVFIATAATLRGLLPSGIYLLGIQNISLRPVSGGGFADVYKGLYNGQLVALKVARIFEDDDSNILKVRSEILANDIPLLIPRHNRSFLKKFPSGGTLTTEIYFLSTA